MEVRPLAEEALARTQPERHRGAHEVDLVTGAGNLQPEFGGHHTGAARPGVAQHTDLHLVSGTGGRDAGAENEG